MSTVVNNYFLFLKKRKAFRNTAAYGKSKNSTYRNEVYHNGTESPGRAEAR